MRPANTTYHLHRWQQAAAQNRCWRGTKQGLYMADSKAGRYWESDHSQLDWIQHEYTQFNHCIQRCCRIPSNYWCTSYWTISCIWNYESVKPHDGATSPGEDRGSYGPGFICKSYWDCLETQREICKDCFTHGHFSYHNDLIGHYWKTVPRRRPARNLYWIWHCCRRVSIWCVGWENVQLGSKNTQIYMKRSWDLSGKVSFHGLKQICNTS